jgi:hypothetical protein
MIFISYKKIKIPDPFDTFTLSIGYNFDIIMRGIR